MIKPIIAGAVAGILFFAYSIAVLEAGRDLGEEAAEPIYYCSDNSTLYMASGTDETDIVIGAVVDPLTDTKVGCNKPGEILERDEITVPSVEHLFKN